MSYALQRNHRKPGKPARVEQPASEPAKQIFLRHYEQSLDEREARAAAHLTRKDLAEARANDPEFDARCTEIEQDGDEKLEHRLKQIARDDPATLRWYLERRLPEKYGTKQRLDINVRDVTKLSDEDLEKYILQCQGKTRP